MARVKICGITRPEDAQLAEAAGADAVGLIFAPHSRRRLSVERAQAISDVLGPLIARIGVFADQPLSEVEAIAEALRLSALQLHGAESAEYARALQRRYPVIKAFRFTPELTTQQLADYPADAILLDSPAPGSGQRFNWQAAQSLAGYPRLIVAGGLTPENVGQAIDALSPYGVDVASGVEAAPGIKDASRVVAFVRAAKGRLGDG